MEKADFKKAEWIWTADNLTPDQKVAVRKKFSLTSVPASADILISCDTKFWLWVNGTLAVYEGGVFRESVKGSGYAEKLDIAPYLKPGENVIALLVYFYGNGGRNNTNSGEAGIILACDALGLYSGSDFLISRHPAFVRTGEPHPSYLYGGDNIGFDARLDFGDFTALDFDDSSFENAAVYPNKVWGDSYISPLPLLRVYPVTELDFVPADGGARAKLPYAMTLSVGFEIEAQGGEKIDIRTDRYHINGGPGDEHHTYRGHRIEYTAKKGLNRFVCPMYLYGEELLLTFPSGVKLDRLYCYESGYDTKRIGTFVTDNELFNRLIEKSVRTLYVCMRNNFMDCPDRERGQWIGDITVQTPQVFFIFDGSARKLLKKAVGDFINLRHGDVLMGNVPGENSSELPGQSLAAIGECGMIAEYWHYSHDADIPALVLEPAVNYLKLWDMADNGLVKPRSGDWRWFDHLMNIDETLIENLLYFSACKFALKLANELGDHRFDPFLNARASSVSEAIERDFWKGDRYASSDFADDRANALAVLTGICPPERYPVIRKVLVTVFNSTTYMERFVLSALCEMGYTGDAFRRMMSRYYNLASNDNSTLWEDFYILGTKNHAWSGCPIEIAYKYFLGLKTDDAFKTYTVDPVTDIFKEIRCTFPVNGETVEKIYRFDDEK